MEAVRQGVYDAFRDMIFHSGGQGAEIIERAVKEAAEEAMAPADLGVRGATSRVHGMRSKPALNRKRP
jgi:hypothetical protein